MAQQTALDFFLMKLVDLEIGKTFYPNQHQDLQDAFKQAKQMEKEQIQKAFSNGQEIPINHPTLPHYSGEEYYNETFKK